jgi:hypothetical protein
VPITAHPVIIFYDLMGEANGAYLHWRDANRNYLGASNNVRIKNGVRRTLLV